MANEPSKISPAVKPAGAAAAKTDAPVAGKPAVAPAPLPVAVAAGQSAPLFGGHRGGGKKRLDGLPAGSPEAIEADKAKDRERKNRANALKRAASLPPPLPGATAPAQTPGAPVDLNPPAMPGAVAVAPLVAGSAPMFVAWSQKLLEKPAKLLVKIVDRVRCWSLMKSIRKLELSVEQEKEIAADLRWQDEATADFSNALAECATVELNKRRISGAQNSHWINLAMTSGELVYSHIQALEKIEKMLLEKRAQLAKEMIQEQQSLPGREKPAA